MKKKNVKILAADDDASILEVIELMLGEEGYDVMTTSDGETLYTMEGDLPAVLLLDIWMSGHDGRDICKYLKSQESTRHIPIIMVSANKDTDIIARQAGADDFIAKPFEMDELLAKVKKYAFPVKPEQ